MFKVHSHFISRNSHSKHKTVLVIVRTFRYRMIARILLCIHIIFLMFSNLYLHKFVINDMSVISEFVSLC